MIGNIFTSLVNAGLLTTLLTVLIILITSFIIFIYFKVLYKSTAFGYPSTMKRLFAFLYDIILLNFAILILAITYGIISGTLVEVFKEYSLHLNNSTESTYYTGFKTLKSDFWQLQFYIVIVFSIYSFMFEAFGEKTIGKRVMGISVADKEHKPALWQSFVRNVVKIPVVAMWPVFLPISLIDKKRRWIHDFASKSVLISESV